MLKNCNKQTRMRHHVRHMNRNRLKLCEYRLLADIRINGDTPAKQKRLAKIRASLYGSM